MHLVRRLRAEGETARQSDLRVPLIELGTTAALGGLSYLAAGEEAGVFVTAAGLIVTAGYTRIEAYMGRRFERLDRLADVIDLGTHYQVDDLRALLAAYMTVPEPEFQSIKDGIVASARDDLLRLAREKSSGELPPGEYYGWLLPMLEAARPPTVVRALSLMMKCEWDNSPSEQRFIEASIAAAERGVRTERIFVMRSRHLGAAISNPAVRAHLREEGPANLQGYYVDLDWVSARDPKLRNRLGDGFIAFDDRVALVDLHSKDGSARGEVTKLPHRLKALGVTHAQLMLHSKVLSLDLVDPPDGGAAAHRPAA